MGSVYFSHQFTIVAGGQMHMIASCLGWTKFVSTCGSSASKKLRNCKWPAIISCSAVSCELQRVQRVEHFMITFGSVLEDALSKASA
jgi:hypothetical protein